MNGHVPSLFYYVTVNIAVKVETELKTNCSIKTLSSSPRVISQYRYTELHAAESHRVYSSL